MLIGVTGASGFIGQALVPALLHAGHQVRVLARSPAASAQQTWHTQVQWFQGDLQQADTLGPFCQACDAIIHLAALAHVNATRRDDHQQSTVLGTQALLQALVAQGVPSLVYISSIKASEQAAASAYARAKASAEQQVKAAANSGLKALILRPAIVYGPGMKGNLASWIRRLQQGWLPGLPSSAANLRMVSRRNLCEAIILSLPQVSTQAPVFEVNDGVSYHLYELEQQLRQTLGKPVSTLPMPRWLWRLAALAGDAIFRLSGRSIGFSSQSYATLFVQEATAKPPLPGFKARDTLQSALPVIIASL